MFDFEKLDVYQEIRGVNVKVLEFVQNNAFDAALIEQLKNASMGVLLNLAEGTGQMSGAEKKKFYIAARSSVFESVALLQMISDLELIDLQVYEEIYAKFDKVSRMLLGMIRAQE